MGRLRNFVLKTIKYSLAAFVLFIAQNFHVEPGIYFIKRALAGAPVVCSPWTLPEDDDGSCMERQRALDKKYGVKD